MIFRGLILSLALALVCGFSFNAKAGDLHVVKVLDGKAEISLPAGFTLMSEDMKHLKYPSSSPPKEVYSDESGDVNVAMKIIPNPRKVSVEALLSAMAGGVDRVGNITWHDKGKRTIHGFEFGYLEFNARPQDKEIYNYIYVTQAGDEMLMFNFNSTVEKLPAWRETITKVVASTRILVAP